MTINFDGQVALITGAGGGLGRSHALQMAARGAKVVVNDFDAKAAQAVVDEIVAVGGIALAYGANVADMGEVSAMVAAVTEQWGRIDILVNNAGILRDKSFMHMDMANFEAVMAVHLMGSVYCTKAVWPIMRAQNYGRVVMTTSSSGLYGNFGQTNYGAAKLSLVGLMQSLGIEGKKYNIRVNCLAPVADTNMTKNLMPEEALALLQPELVSPAVLYLASDDAPSRVILSAGAGCFARAYISETDGVAFDPDTLTPEKIADHWTKISDKSTAIEMQEGSGQTMKFLQKAMAMKKS